MVLTFLNAILPCQTSSGYISKKIDLENFILKADLAKRAFNSMEIAVLKIPLQVWVYLRNIITLIHVAVLIFA